MVDYTKKSQDLAALKAKIAEKTAEAETAKAPWSDPEWTPESYEQLGATTAEQAARLAEQRVWEKISAEAGREAREQQERDEYVKQEIEHSKSLDKNVNVNEVMAHAAKYAFSSLIPAHQNLKALQDAEKRVEERVLKNLQARANTPVGLPGGASGANIVFPPGVRTGTEKALYILKNQQ